MILTRGYFPRLTELNRYISNIPNRIITEILKIGDLIGRGQIPKEYLRLYYLLYITFIWQVVLGLHIVRGDNIAVIGEIDEEIDKRLDLKNVRAEPITSIVH